jgi:hypothetical protein
MAADTSGAKRSFGAENMQAEEGTEKRRKNREGSFEFQCKLYSSFGRAKTWKLNYVEVAV